MISLKFDEKRRVAIVMYLISVRSVNNIGIENCFHAIEFVTHPRVVGIPCHGKIESNFFCLPKRSFALTFICSV